jgi:hypothetical protein
MTDQPATFNLTDLQRKKLELARDRYLALTGKYILLDEVLDWALNELLNSLTRYEQVKAGKE